MTKLDFIDSEEDLGDIVEIIVQPLVLLIVQTKTINYYRLATDTIITPKNNSCVAPEGVTLDGAVLDPANPAVILAPSSSSNTVEIFEGKGKGLKF